MAREGVTFVTFSIPEMAQSFRLWAPYRKSSWIFGKILLNFGIYWSQRVLQVRKKYDLFSIMILSYSECLEVLSNASLSGARVWPWRTCLTAAWSRSVYYPIALTVQWTLYRTGLHRTSLMAVRISSVRSDIAAQITGISSTVSVKYETIKFNKCLTCSSLSSSK